MPTLILISLILILIGNIGAWSVKTLGGKVTVVGLKLPTENGQWIAADLFKPKSATEKTPAPLVVVCPGFERSKETMDAYSIELARRGLAVITIDPYGQGASSSSLQRRSTTVEGNGVIPILEYAASTPNINYIDKSKIGAVGYSSGGNAVLQTAARFGEREEKALKKAASPTSDGGTEITEAEQARARSLNKLAAIYIGGYVLTLTDEVLAPVRTNIGMDYAYFDEGAFRNEQGHARMKEAPEALRLVNTVFPGKPLASVNIGETYGDAKDRTLRVVHNTRNIHPMLPYDRTHIGNVINYFTTVFDMKPSQPGSSQIWPLKELFTLLSLVGAFLFLVPFTSLLLRLPAFASLAQPVPPQLPAPSRNGKILFWVLFCGSAVAACFLFIPLAKVTAVLFPQASARIPTWWFPQRINNAILLWAIANGLIGLVTFFLTYQLHGKKNGVTPDMWGIRLPWKELAKTFMLALCVFASFYALLFASYGAFHTDFRFIFVSAAASFPKRMLLVALEYLPAFFIFYLANSIRVNSGSRFDGQKEWLNMLVNGFGNSVGLMMILAIQYSCFASTGTIYWKQEWLYVNLLLGVIPMMFLLPYLNRYFFRLTGTVYLGPMITCMIFVMMMLTSNVCYIPLD